MKDIVVLSYILLLSFSSNKVVVQAQHEEEETPAISVKELENPYNEDYFESSSEYQEHRMLRSAADYTYIGGGYCNVGYTEKNQFKGETNPNNNDCIGLCGNSITGYSFREDKWETCKGWNIFNVCIGGYKDQYRLHCRCHSGGPVTGLNAGGWQCYGYNKGDQIAGTSQQNNFFYAGQGQCVGTVNGQVFSSSTTSHSTDLACANQCSSSIAFSRKLDSNTCYCHSQGTGTGDVKASSNNNYNCYSRLYDRIFEDGSGLGSGFTYAGVGIYSGRTSVGTYNTDAQCAERCLDTYANSGGLVGITHQKNGGTCWCATSGSVGGGDKQYTSYSLDASRVFSCPANSALRTTVTNNGITLQTVCKCTDNGGTAKTLSIYNSETCACPAPSTWCTNSEHDKHNIAFDCDGDGNNDSLCVTKDQYFVLNSQNQCIQQTGTNVVGDCYAASYGNVLGSSAPDFFWRGIGPCWGSYANPNQEQFSHFEIQASVTTDLACAQACAARDELPHKVVSFSRRVYLNRCYCQYQKDTADFSKADAIAGIYNGDGIGGVVIGDDRRYSCYGHYQEGNQVIDSSVRFLVNDGRTRHELKGIGPCRDSFNRQFPHFQIADQASDDLCWQNCLSEFSDIVGIARHQTANHCFCHYDSDLSKIPGSVNYAYLRPHGTGVGEVFAGYLDEFHCVAKVQGLSGFDFKGNGPCRSSSNNNQYPHFQISGQTTSHTDAECGDRCLRAFPEGVIGFWRHKENFNCYCLYESGDSIPGTVSAINFGGGSGTGKYDVTAAGTDIDKSCYGLDETSRVTDCPDNSVLDTELNSEGLKVLESWCDCDGGNGKDVYENDDTCSCARPYRWCTEPGDEYLFLDCDNDDTMDSVCVNDEGYTTMKSQNACDEEEGADVNAICSAASGCSKASNWCNGAGDEYSFLDCDGDGAKDSVCNSGGSYKVALSSNDCNDQNSVAIGTVCPAVNGCPRASNWCTGRGNRYFYIDCDGDGALDSLCETSNTTYLLQRSSDGCVETSADDITLSSVCPASGCMKPETWCGHPGSQYYYVDCDGDNVLDSHCRDEDGRTWAILSGDNCQRSRDRCPAADYCTHRDDWCLHAGSHFYSVDPDGTYGNDDSQCILHIGTQWEDTNCYRRLTDVRTEREYILSKS